MLSHRRMLVKFSYRSKPINDYIPQCRDRRELQYKTNHGFSVTQNANWREPISRRFFAQWVRGCGVERIVRRH
jgi:hypothetical protein